MRLVCISDTHGRHNELDLPDGDILIHAGDISRRGTQEELDKFFNWFNKVVRDRYRQGIIIAGNHDFGLQKGYSRIVSGYITYLKDSSIEIDGFKIHGFPWTPIFYDWAFMKSDEEMRQQVLTIPEDADILISHGPAYRILDKTEEKVNAGSLELRQRIQSLKNLKIHIFGHIHEAYGNRTVLCKEIGNRYHAYNCSVLNRRYELVNPCTVIEV